MLNLPSNYGPKHEPVYVQPKKRSSSYLAAAHVHQSKKTHTTEITLEVALQQELYAR